MPEIERSAAQRIDASVDTVWQRVADPAAMAGWWAFCDTCTDPEPGTRVFEGDWGSQRSRVTAAITAMEPPGERGPGGRIAWRHVSEELDGRPAPRYSAETTVEIRVQPLGARSCAVTATSVQVPSGVLRGVIMRLLGGRQMRAMLTESLDLLAKIERSR